MANGFFRIDRSTRSLSFLLLTFASIATAMPPTATAAATTKPSALRSRLGLLFLDGRELRASWRSFVASPSLPNASTTRPPGFFPFFPLPLPARPPLYGFMAVIRSVKTFLFCGERVSHQPLTG